MIFLETPNFTGRILELLSDEEYGHLQTTLLKQPDLGDIIPGSGGLRKLRWASSGRGKRGGARIIYYWAAMPDQTVMLAAYAKNRKTDLTPSEIKPLRRIIEEEYK